jgi:hypothetical protein
LEIGEKVKKLRWCARPNSSSLSMLATNDRTVKLWKVYVSIEHGIEITLLIVQALLFCRISS